MPEQNQVLAEANNAVAMSRLVTADPPRADELCRPYVRMIEPTVGFVVYGLLWCVFSLVALGVFAFVGMEAGELLHASAHGKDTLVLVFAWAGAALVWIPYVWFVRGRLRRARRHVRAGTFIPARALGASVIPGTQAITGVASLGSPPGRPRIWFRTAFDHGGKTFHVRCPFADRPAPGTEVLVLFHPDSNYVLAFSYLDTPSVCRLDRD